MTRYFKHPLPSASSGLLSLLYLTCRKNFRLLSHRNVPEDPLPPPNSEVKYRYKVTISWWISIFVTVTSYPAYFILHSPSCLLPRRRLPSKLPRKLPHPSNTLTHPLSSESTTPSQTRPQARSRSRRCRGRRQTQDPPSPMPSPPNNAFEHKINQTIPAEKTSMNFDLPYLLHRRLPAQDLPRPDLLASNNSIPSPSPFSSSTPTITSICRYDH